MVSILWFVGFFWLCAAQCPDGALYFSATNRCFAINTTPLNWSNARNYCKKLGGELVSIHEDSEEKYLIRQVAKRTLTNYQVAWIGLELDLNSEGIVEEAKWTDGTPLDYTDWALPPATPPPCRMRPDDCGYLSVYSTQPGWLYCLPCETKVSSVCDVPLATTTAPLV